MERSPLALLGWLRNALDFPIRQTLRWRRAGARLPAEPKENLFPAEALPEVERLVRAYDLASWQQRSGRTDFAASLFYLQMLERALTESPVRLPPDRVIAADLGCGDWFYVQALHGLLRHWNALPPRAVALDGVEVDAWQLYSGFHSRHDWALAYAQGTGAQYLPRDIRQYNRALDLAFMLFPFLFAADVRRWGLPLRYLRPAELLIYAWALVKPGGALILANLGNAERQEQHRLMAAANLPVTWWAAHRSPLFRYQEDRYITVACKPGTEAPAVPTSPDLSV